MRVDVVLLEPSQLERISQSGFGPVVVLSETTSTNAVLMDEARRGARHGLAVVADHQSAGRGRYDRHWEAPPGSSLLVSVLLRPLESELPARRRHLAVAAVSLAVAEAAQVVAGVELALKWPNDLIDPADRKVAGALAEVAATPGALLGAAPELELGAAHAENRQEPFNAARPAGAPPPVHGPERVSAPGVAASIVVGVGLNVAWAPEAMAATCLEALAGHRVDRGEVLVESLLALGRLYGHWDEVARRYRESCATLGREVTIELAGGGAELNAVAEELDDDGCLLARDGEGGLVRVAAGDVVHASALRPPRVVGQ